ncbi:hypothetical protein ACWYVZ_06610 [Pediococcus acidilactici]
MNKLLIFGGLKMRYDRFTEADVQNFFDYYYLDRGIIKWQGYYLSDHLSVLERDAERRDTQLREEELLRTRWNEEDE